MPKKPRSTRDKIRRISAEIVSSLERIQGRLQRIDELCANRSPWIDDHLPQLVTGTEALKKAFQLWHDGL